MESDHNQPPMSPEEVSRMIDDLIAGRLPPPEPAAVHIDHHFFEGLDAAARAAFEGAAHIVAKEHPGQHPNLIAMKAHALAYAAGQVFKLDQTLGELRKVQSHWMSDADRLIGAEIRRSLATWRDVIRQLVDMPLSGFCAPAARPHYFEDEP